MQTVDHQRRLCNNSLDCIVKYVKTNAFASTNASINRSRLRTVLFWLSCHSAFQCVPSTCAHLCDRIQFAVVYCSIFVALNESCCIKIENMTGRKKAAAKKAAKEVPIEDNKQQKKTDENNKTNFNSSG